MSDTEAHLPVPPQKAQPETVALFVSDVHLQASLPRTTQAFIDFLQGPAMRTRQLFLLGDLFEYWAGDDDIDDAYHRRIVDAIRVVSDSGVAVFWIAGNRDFLVGDAFAQAAGVTLLPDPYIAIIGGLRIALAHGDAQCTDDTAYMKFRAQVRQQQWQRQFLALPLAERKSIIQNLRAGSREAQRAKSYAIMDVNSKAIAELLEQTGASILIHGHTHRPAKHADAASGHVRYVLPDWDCDEAPAHGDVARGGWIEVDTAGGIHERRINTPG